MKPNDSRYILTNCIVADPANGLFIKNGAILVENDIISEVNNVDKMKANPGTKVYDLNGRLVIPGMLNPHHHLYSALSTGLAPVGETPNFTKILENLWWRLDLVLEEESVYYSAIAGILDSIRHGVTTIFDHHASMAFVDGSLDTIAKAFDTCGIKGQLCFETSDRISTKYDECTENGNAIKHIEENVSFFEKHRDNDNIKGAFGIHANFTISESTMCKIAESKPDDMPIHIHCAEDKADYEYCRNLGYKGSIDRLNSYKLLNSDSLIIHAIYLDNSELELLNSIKPIIVNNSESNANNGVGMMTRENIEEYLIGTDGMMSDMIHSMRSHFLLGSLPKGFPGLADTFFKNTQKAQQRFFKNTGELKSGYKADIAVLDYTPLTPISSDSLLGHLIFGARTGKAYMTICNGNILYENGTFHFLNEEKLMAEIRNSSEKLHKRYYE